MPANFSGHRRTTHPTAPDSHGNFKQTGSFRQVAQSLFPSARTWIHELTHNQGSPAIALRNISSIFYSHRNLHHGWFSSHMLYEAKKILCKSRGSSASCRFTYHAQIASRRLFVTYSYNGLILSPISRIARAVSLSLSRSHLLAPGILAFIIGEITLNQRYLSHADNLPTKDMLYVHAQGGHIYVSSILFSLLEGLLLVLRAGYLAILFSPSIFMAPFSNSLGVEFRRSWLCVVRITLERAGPAFIKWGQWAAARPDLFPNDLCNELAELHSKAPAHSFAYTKSTVENAFGRKLAEIFDEFDEEPVASGSVAQVHQATLRSRYPRQKAKPKLVAVKVRHPGVGEAIRRDFVLINLFAKVSKFVPTLKWLRLDESIQQFAVFMTSQVDLAREAANLSRFIYNFRHWKDVSFPKPVYPLVHPAVLVETYEHGESILHYVDRLEGHGHVKTALAHIGTHALLKMLLGTCLMVRLPDRSVSIEKYSLGSGNMVLFMKVDNFIHADMHPGNILVRELGSKSSGNTLFKSRPEVVFLDVGMTAELSKKDRDNLLGFFKAVALRDGRSAAECTLRLSNKQKCPYPEAFIVDVDSTFKFWGSGEGDFVHPADCMQQMLEQVRRHRVNIDGNICTVIVTTMVLEGWQRKLDPEYDAMEALQTLLFKADLVDSLFYTMGGVMAP